MTSTPASPPDIDTRVLLLRLGAEWYAVAATQVRELVRWRDPVPVPGTPAALLGVFNLRGTIMPLIDARLLLGLSQPSRSRSTRLVVVDMGELQAALLADEVDDLLSIAASERSAPPVGSGPYTSALLDTPHGRAGLLDLRAMMAALRAA